MSQTFARSADVPPPEAASQTPGMRIETALSRSGKIDPPCLAHHSRVPRSEIHHDTPHPVSTWPSMAGRNDIRPPRWNGNGRRAPWRIEPVRFLARCLQDMRRRHSNGSRLEWRSPSPIRAEASGGEHLLDGMCDAQHLPISLAVTPRPTYLRGPHRIRGTVTTQRNHPRRSRRWGCAASTD